MREPTQRFWDAMIIKAWQNFYSCRKLAVWANEEFGVFPQHLGLKRAKNCYGAQGVRVWVASYMPTLSSKLFSLPKERHVEILDWLAKSKVDSLSSKGSQSRKYYNEVKGINRISERRAAQATWSWNLEKNMNKNNSWTKVK